MSTSLQRHFQRKAAIEALQPAPVDHATVAIESYNDLLGVTDELHTAIEAYQLVEQFPDGDLTPAMEDALTVAPADGAAAAPASKPGMLQHLWAKIQEILAKIKALALKFFAAVAAQFKALSQKIMAIDLNPFKGKVQNTIDFTVPGHVAAWVGNGVHGAMPSDVLKLREATDAANKLMAALVALQFLDAAARAGSLPNLTDDLAAIATSMQAFACPVGPSRHTWSLRDSNWRSHTASAGVMLATFRNSLEMRELASAHEADVKGHISAQDVFHFQKDLEDTSRGFTHLATRLSGVFERFDKLFSHPGNEKDDAARVHAIHEAASLISKVSSGVMRETRSYAQSLAQFGVLFQHIVKGLSSAQSAAEAPAAA